jgi:hypothetical protein
VFLWQKVYLDEVLQISNETAVMELHDEAWCMPDIGFFFFFFFFVCGFNTSFIADCTDKVNAVTIINASLIGFAYPSEMFIPAWQGIGERRHMFHIPKTVSAERFYKPPDPSEKPPESLEEAVAAYDRARDIDVLLIGYMHRWIYPIRWKVLAIFFFLFNLYCLFFKFDLL